MDDLEEFARAKFYINGIQYLPIKYKYNDYSEVAVIRSEQDYEGDIVIPHRVKCLGEYYEVTKIGENAFQDCKELTSVKLSKGLGAIGNEAFRGCISLSSISLPSNLEVICDRAFEDCVRLQTVKLDKQLRGIGRHSFANCIELTRITLPANLEQLGDEAFAECCNLSVVKLPDSLLNLGSDIFRGTRFWSNLPDGVVYKSNYLLGCKGKAPDHLVLKEGTKLIADKAFYQSENLLSVECSSELINIGASAFEFCKTLQKVVFNDNLRTLEKNSFGHCEQLSAVSFGQHLNTIGDRTFEGCTCLECIALPLELIKIGCRVFSDTLFWRRQTDDIVYMNNYLLGCKSNKIKKVEVKAGTTLIADYAFMDISGLKTLVLPHGLQVIGECAFFAAQIKHLVIPDGVIEIGPQAFGRCSELESVYLPASLKVLNVASFFYTKNLSSIFVNAVNPPHVVDNLNIPGFISGEELYKSMHYGERILCVDRKSVV